MRSSAAASAVGVEDLDLAAALGVADRATWATSSPAARARSSQARSRSALRAASTSSGAVATGWPRPAARRVERGRARARSPRTACGDRVGHAQQVLLGQAVDVAEVGRVALHDAHAGAALAAALGTLDAAVVEREREAAPVLGVELGEVAAARQRALEHALGQLGIDQRHDVSPACGSSRRVDHLRSAAARTSARSCPRASGCSRRA